jgi:membrane-associated protease RseP (regulator of RpoE activity)
MATSSVPADVPDPESLTDTFYVYEVEVQDDDVRYYGEPLETKESVLETVAPLFRERGYRVQMNYETGEHVLVATERSTSIDGIPWTNVVLFVATVFTTLFAGAEWYGVDLSAGPAAILGAWDFAFPVMAVLAIHELGHYVLSRRHDVEATLPYFIPVPFALGTFGAVIRMKDSMPSRKALFDIGVAGPLAGLGATVVVTAVGVSLPPVEVGANAVVSQIEFGYPLLVQGIAAALGEPLQYGAGLAVNPVVIGGWVGAFLTFLNMLPVGQLDGAHVTRALVGERITTVQTVVPGLLFALAGYLFVFEGGQGASLWALWGVLTLVIARAGNAQPIDDTPVGTPRQVVGLLTVLLGLLCFTPIPIAITA